MRFPSRCLILLALAVLANAAAVAQGPATPPPSLDSVRFKRVYEDHGLTHSDVRAIAQDKEGFIWLALRIGGLARYDGYELKIYEHDPVRPTSLGHRVIWSLLVDRQGRIWVGTEGGLDRFDPVTETFHHFRHEPERADSLPNNIVVCLFEDSHQRLWAGTRRGLARLDDESTGRFTTFLRPQVVEGSPANDTIRSVTEDTSTGLFWLGTSDGLAAFDPRTGAMATYLHDPEDPTSLSRNSVNAVVQDPDGGFWALTEHGLNAFRPTFDRVPQHSVQEPRLTFTRYFHPDGAGKPGTNFLRHGLIDRHQRLWLASRGGLLVFDRESGRFTTFQRRPGDPSGLNDNTVQAVYEDRSGNLWVGTFGGGASMIGAGAKPFRTHRHVPGDPTTLSDDRVTGLAFDPQGRLWTASNEGLNRLEGGRWVRCSTTGSGTELPDLLVSTIAVAPNGDVWLGTPYDGALRLDGQGLHRFVAGGSHVPAADGYHCFTGRQVNSILPDAQGGIWLGARAYGIDYFRDGLFRHFRPQPAAGNQPERPIANSVFGILAEDGVWFATEAGRLARLDPATEQFTFFTAPTAVPGTTSSLLCIADGADGIIWIGAADGLLEFDRKQGRFVRHLRRSDGLPHHAVVSIVRDHRGLLWLGTPNGLAEFDPRSGRIRSFERSDGLPSNAFIQRAGVAGPDGRLYFGTRSGLVEFRPEEICDDPSRPPVVLTELRWVGAPPDGEEPVRAASPVGRQVIVPPGQLGFTLRFAALDFDAPERNRYRHRLQGWESDWVEGAAAERSATYTSLPPGTYTFEVQAGRANSGWTEPGATVQVVVQPHFWQTFWFRAAVVVASVVLVAGGLHWRFHLIRKRNAALEKQVTQRTAQLQREVNVRQQAESALRESHAELERRVQHRTSELAHANAELQSQIAERRNVEAQLRQSQKMEAIGQLAGGVAHDFNNLLTVILGQIDLMEATDLPPEVRSEAVRDITTAAQRASNLTRQLLVFSRHQAMKPAPLDINCVVADVSKLLNRVIGERIRLENQLSREPLCAQGDAGMLEQVLLNMALNARDAMPRGGHLRLTTCAMVYSADHIAGLPQARPGRYARISVSDSGVGIPDHVLPHIFDPFFTTKDAGKGTGLGLAISLDIIQQHGGWIDVESRAGEGTTFHVHLPAQPAPSAAAEPAAPRVLHSKGHTTILLAEDEGAVRNVVRTVLTRQGYRVIEANSGSDALLQWRRHQHEIALLLTDIVMPGPLDGHQLAAVLLKEAPTLRIITMSGYDPRETSQAAGVPGHTHLRKPFTADDLLMTVEAVLIPQPAAV